MALAREALKRGRTLVQAAGEIGVLSCELDLVLWREIGRRKRAPEPMF